MTEANDLALLPPDIAAAGNVDADGEVWWPADCAARAINALAGASLVILGIDLRDYDEDGRFVEIAWSAFEPTGTDDAERSRVAALAALARPGCSGNAVLITWRPAA